MEQARIPSGFQDLITQQARKKRLLQQNLQNLFRKFGYEEIMTPALEFYQTYNLAFNALEDSQMFKYIDENGEILSLRLDMTVPIARVAASKFKDSPTPLRFCYATDVFKIRQSFAGKKSEVTDCGIECIGLSEKNDLEILVLALEALKEIGVENYTLEIGNTRFFDLAAKDFIKNKKDREILADLIDRKSMIELKEFVQSLNLELPVQNFFLSIPWLAGSKEALLNAYELAYSDELKEVVANMMELHENLCALSYEDKVSYDFGKIPHLNYYTGILFEGYVEGVGTSVLSGGRYDSLLQKFGKNWPACGFSIKLDYLLDVYQKEENEKQAVLYYPQDEYVQALLTAKKLREEFSVTLMPWNEDFMEVKVKE